MTRANAKAIGAIGANDSALDGAIVMNNLNGTGVSWQYDYLSSGVGSNKLDFTSVMIHEIGHTLGFVSSLDSYTYSDYYSGFDEEEYESEDDMGRVKLRKNWTTMDMFRYYTAQNGAKNRGLWYGGNSYQYLSIDGGANSLAFLANGSDTRIGGDGYQASHYRNDLDAGIMDPVLELNTRRYLESDGIDLSFFDAIGWDRQSESIDLVALQNNALLQVSNAGNVDSNEILNKLHDLFNQYGWGRGNGNGNGNGNGSKFRQEVSLAQNLSDSGFFQVGVFQQKFDLNAHKSSVSASVPEPTSTVGLLGLGLLGLVCSKKRNSQ